MSFTKLLLIFYSVEALTFFMSCDYRQRVVPECKSLENATLQRETGTTVHLDSRFLQEANLMMPLLDSHYRKGHMHTKCLTDLVRILRSQRQEFCACITRMLRVAHRSWFGTGVQRCSAYLFSTFKRDLSSWTVDLNRLPFIACNYLFLTDKKSLALSL